MGQKILCIVAGQRAGTTAFASILGSTGKFQNFGEIFHTHEIERPGRYFEFCRARKILIGDIRTTEQVCALCDSYLDHLRGLAGTKHVLIDVKFNSWNVLSPPWRYQSEEPFFLSYLKSKGAYFTLIRRRNVADQILSESIARAADSWHNLTEEKLPPGPVQLEIADVAKRAGLICLSENLFSDFLKSSDRCFQVDYEDLFVDDVLSQQAKNRLQELFGEKFVFGPTSPIRRNVVDKSAIVENYDEVIAAIADAVSRFRR